MRRFGLAVVGLALALVVGAVLWSFRERPRPCEPLQVPKRALTDADRLAAMLTVHGYAYRNAGIFKIALTDLKLLPLETAAEILNADGDPLAPSRRRRAVAKLAAYGGEDPEINLRWRQLLSCDRDKIREIVALLKAGQGAILSTIESNVYNALAAPAAPQCKDAKFEGPIWDEAGVSAQLALTVEQRDIDWVAARLDPQAWDDQSLLFVSTFLTTDAVQASTTCPVNPSTPPDPLENNQKPYGSAYQAVLLFEHFRCGLCDSEFKNLLGVQAVRNSASCDSAPNPCGGTAPPYQACFWLQTPLAGCHGAVAVNLTNDQGALTACLVAGETRVTSRKEIKFAQSLATFATYAALVLQQQEATESLAEMVGCDLPAQ